MAFADALCYLLTVIAPRGYGYKPHGDTKPRPVIHRPPSGRAGPSG